MRSLRKTKKIGRNDPCPCGSRKKYKKCCLGIRPNPSVTLKEPPLHLQAKIQQHFLERTRAEARRRAEYGEVRPEISAKFQGRQFVAVGKKLFHSDKWKFFPDFLASYVETTFGKEWGNAELAKPEAERHPFVRLRNDGLRYMNAQPTLPDGSRNAYPNGAFAAYLTLAYDLYVVDHNGRLDDALLERLKHPLQFQGARHELFAEATCLRAGFSIEREDERDRANRHAEFTAVHTKTGQKVSVEAKSRHRPGVLGFPGVAQPHEKLSLRFGELINDAIKKNPQHPLVVFIDTNLPMRAADRLLGRDPKAVELAPTRLMRGLLERIRKEHGGVDPYSMLIFTNHPHHFAAAEEHDPPMHLSCWMPQNPGARPEALIAIANASSLYSNIPQGFPEAPDQTQAGYPTHRGFR
jgi:SEC-C motif